MIASILLLPALASLSAIAPQDFTATLNRLELGISPKLATTATLEDLPSSLLDSALISTELSLDLADLVGLESESLDAVGLGLVVK